MFDINVVVEMLAPLKGTWCYDDLISRIPLSLPEHVRTVEQFIETETVPILGTMVDTVYNIYGSKEGNVVGYDVWIFTMEDGSHSVHTVKPYDVSGEESMSCMKFDTTPIPKNTATAMHIETGSVDIFDYLEGIHIRHYTRAGHLEYLEKMKASINSEATDES